MPAKKPTPKPKAKPKSEPKPKSKHKLPAGMIPWKPGQSGNPGGRPKLFESLFTQAMAKIFKEPHPETGDTNVAVLARATFDMCLKQINKGKLDKSIAGLTQYMIDRVEGKPRQAITIGKGEDDVSQRSNEELAYYLANGTWPESVSQETNPSA